MEGHVGLPVRFIRCTEEDIRKMSLKSSEEQDENSTEEQSKVSDEKIKALD